MRCFRAAIVLASLAFSVFARAETILITSGDSFAPLVYASNGKPAGLLPRILELASRHSGDTYELRLFPWKRALSVAERSEMGILGLPYTAERARIFDYSTTLYDNAIYVVTRADSAIDYRRLEDLNGKVVGAFNGESFGEAVDKAVAKGLFIIEVDGSNTGRMMKVLAGRLDAAFLAGGVIGLDTAIRQDASLAAQRKKFRVHEQPLVHDPLHLAFHKNMKLKEALVRFDKAMATIRKNGELKRLLAEPSP